MRKLFLFCFVIALCFTLIACGKNDTGAATEVPTTESATIPGLDPTIMDPTIETNIPDPETNKQESETSSSDPMSTDDSTHKDTENGFK